MSVKETFEFFTCLTEEEAKEKAKELGWGNPKIEYDDFFGYWVVSALFQAG